MLMTLAKKTRAALIGGVVMWLCAAQAQAASFSGSWDPAFGNGFPFLGWRGTVKIFVPDACLIESANDGSKLFTLENNASGCTATQELDLEEATVQLYDTRITPVTPIRTLFYDGESELEQFIKVYLLSGKVVGVTARFNDFVSPSQGTDISMTDVAPGKRYDLDDYQFDLDLVADQDAAGRFTCPYLVSRKGTNDNAQAGPRSDRCVAGQGIRTWTNLDGEISVPEPGSLALLLPAIGMLAAFRRRRPAATAD